MAIHVLLNQKGGVGKSTLSVNLAAVTADVLNRGDDPEHPRRRDGKQGLDSCAHRTVPLVRGTRPA